MLGEGALAELQWRGKELVEGAPLRASMQHHVVPKHVLGHRHKLALVTSHLFFVASAEEAVWRMVSV